MRTLNHFPRRGALLILAALVLGVFGAGPALATTTWDFEDGTSGNWYVSTAAGAYVIRNVADTDSGSRAMELKANTTSTWFALAGPGRIPLNDASTAVQFSVKSSSFFYFIVEADTPAGVRYLYYTPGTTDKLLEGAYVHHALGDSSKDGTWHSFSRNLAADLDQAEPGNTITDINRFLVRGISVRVDNLALAGASAPSGDASLSGSVAGTILVAIVDNQIVASYDTAGLPLDVDTNGDGTPDAHSFSLTGLPTGVVIQVYLVENGQLYPLVLLTGESGTNTFSLASDDPINLGFVQVVTGIAVPQNNPVGLPGVTTFAPQPTPPPTLNSPATAGMSLSDLLNAGFEALAQNWFLRARTYFKAAVELAGNTASNDRDVANVFYAGTRLVSLWFDTYPGRDPAVLESMGDVLDAFGFQFVNGLRGSLHNIQKLDLLADVPAGCPSGADLQDFFQNVVRPEVEGAIANLNAVSPTVLKSWEVPLLHDTVTTDYADALMLRAAAKAALAVLQIQYFYNLDADIYGLIHGTQTMQDLFAAGFLSPKVPGANLEPSKALLIGALEDCVNGMGLIRQRPGDPRNYVVGLFGFTQECSPFAQIAAFAGKTGLEGNIKFNIMGELKVDIEAPVFFTGLNGNALVPPFTGNRITGLFPDPTFGGIFPLGSPFTFPNDIFGILNLLPIPLEMNFNFDGLNANSVPDIIELVNYSSEILALMEGEDPNFMATWLVTQVYDILSALFGETLGDVDVPALSNAAPDFVPASVVYAVAEFCLKMTDQFCDPLFPPTP